MWIAPRFLTGPRLCTQISDSALAALRLKIGREIYYTPIGFDFAYGLPSGAPDRRRFYFHERLVAHFMAYNNLVFSTSTILYTAIMRDVVRVKLVEPGPTVWIELGETRDLALADVQAMVTAVNAAV
jgi:hypothetical protein